MSTASIDFPDHIFHAPLSRSSTSPSLSPSNEHHIYFIPGNPGLISYYSAYLALLHQHCSTDAGLPPVAVHGNSLTGFELGPELDPAALPPSPRLPRSLQQQIDDVEAALIRDFSHVPLILVGHSVGAYILLEIIRRAHVARRTPGERDIGLDIVGGVLLFPTVVDIAKSSHGQIARWLLPLPYFAVVVQALVRVLTVAMPERLLEAAVSAVTGMPDGAGRTTAAFLRSRCGVRQALWMARDEMAEIAEDGWGSEVWGAAETVAESGEVEAPKLCFYFGKADHWVAESTRDALLKSRGFAGGEGEDWKPKMEVDMSGVPHGFCIRHNALVAKKTAEYVVDIIKRRRNRSK